MVDRSGPLVDNILTLQRTSDRPVNKSGLKTRFMRAAGWTLFGHGLSQLIRLGSNLILTRLLAPELYGVMAVGYVVITGLVMFSDIGLTSGAIRHARGDEPTFLNVSWVVQIARGVVITLAGFGVAAALGWAAHAGLLPAHSVYADPRVPTLILIVSLWGLAQGFESTKVWWARRHLSLGLVTKIDIVCQIASTIFMLVWAMISPSVWALATGWVFSAALKTVLTHVWLPGPNNRFEWDGPTFREVFDFGKWVFLSSSFSFLLTSGDRLLLNGLLDSKTMGYYTIALLLVEALKTAVLRVVGYAVLPALGEVCRDRPQDLRETIYRIRRPLDIVCLVSAGALVMLGDPIVRLLYDSRYAPAGWMLSVLSLVLVATRLDVFDQALIAMGRIKLLSLLNGVRLVTLYAAVPTGYVLFGLHGAVTAVASCALINAAMVLTVQGRLHLADFKRELLAFPLFGLGLLLGGVLAWLVRFAS
jgi:O-antigen/teichoic acid export membrane protein